VQSKNWIRCAILNLLLIQCFLLPGFGQLKSKTLDLNAEVSWKYLLYLPKEYDQKGEQIYPLLLFLHGGGESGTSINKVKKHGPPAQIVSGREFPFILLAPQNPHKRRLWDDTAVMLLLDEIVEQYRVDRNRVYLSGLSRGAYGAWRLAVQYPDRFAALIAISGEAPMNYARWIEDLPIWVFHGDSDKSIDVSSSKRMVESLRQSGNRAKLTIYTDTGHDAWTRTYDNPDVYKWMLEQRRSTK